MPGWPSPVKLIVFRHLKLDASPTLQERTLMELIESGELDPEDLMEAGGGDAAMRWKAHVVFGSLRSRSVKNDPKKRS